jgi:ethanolamine utilization microcompartment shell protein EutS
MALNVQLISQPSAGVRRIMAGRLGAAAKTHGDLIQSGAIGLVQGKLVDMIAAADVAEKAADVHVFDLKGSCPQHLTMIGIFGDVSAVQASLDALTRADGLA